MMMHASKRERPREGEKEHLLFKSESMETRRSGFSTMTRALVAALLAHSILARPMSSCSVYRSKRILAFGLGRREALLSASSAVVGGLSFVRTSPALAKEIDEEQVLATTTTTATSPSFAAYSVTPDSSATLNPSLQSIDQDDLFTALGSSSKGGAVWLGEHHNSSKDHMIQVDIAKKLHAARPNTPMAIGLEQVQVQFQPALNDYVSGNISLEKMKELVQWETRWTWPFDNYRPIFETCRQLGIQLVALNVDSEDLALVERAGFPGLAPWQLQKYIPDPYGFAEFAKPVQFRTYVDYVIRPSYDLHRAMGLLQYTISGQKLEEDMPFRNFFSGRILWDEAMASAAIAWTTANPGGLMIGLVGADHVKFQDGIPGRYARMAGSSRECISVILNPTLIDTSPPGTVGSIANSDSSQYPDRIILQLRYLKDDVDRMSPDRVLPASTGGVLALADYIIVM